MERRGTNHSSNHEEFRVSLKDLDELEQSTNDAFFHFKSAWQKQKTTYERIIRGHENTIHELSLNKVNSETKVQNNDKEELLEKNRLLELEVQELKLKLESKRKLALYLYQQKEKWKRLSLASNTVPSTQAANTSTLNASEAPHHLSKFVNNFSPISDEKTPTSFTETPKKMENFKNESTVPNTEERLQMHASDSYSCNEWYHQFSNPQPQQQVPNNLDSHKPPSTPDEFWNLGFP